MPTLTTEQAANRLELELDRCHWSAVDALKATGEPYGIADVDRERTAREDEVLRTADRTAIAALWRTYATSYLYGGGIRRKEQLAAALRRCEVPA